jgi:hypothetical protein
MSSLFFVLGIWGKAGTTGWTNRVFLAFPDRFTARVSEDAIASSGRALQLELQ